MPPPYSRLCDIILSPCMISSLLFSCCDPSIWSCALLSAHTQNKAASGLLSHQPTINKSCEGAGRAALANSVFHNTVYTSLACSMFLQEALLFLQSL